MAQKANKKKTDTWLDIREDFGAKGDGVTDDTQAFKNMISYGITNKVLKFVVPKSSSFYIINGLIDLPEGTHLIGLGFPEVKRTVRATLDGSNVLGAYSIFGTAGNNILIEGLVINGNGLNIDTTTAGNPNPSQYSDVMLYNTATNDSKFKVGQVTIRNCIFKDSPGSCIGGSAKSLVVENCTFNGWKDHAFYISAVPQPDGVTDSRAARDIIFTKNFVFKQDAYGIDNVAIKCRNHTYNLIISDNVFDLKEYDAIIVHGVEATLTQVNYRVVIQNNTGVCKNFVGVQYDKTKTITGDTDGTVSVTGNNIEGTSLVYVGSFNSSDAYSWFGRLVVDCNKFKYVGTSNVTAVDIRSFLTTYYSEVIVKGNYVQKSNLISWSNGCPNYLEVSDNTIEDGGGIYCADVLDSHTISKVLVFKNNTLGVGVGNRISDALTLNLNANGKAYIENNTFAPVNRVIMLLDTPSQMFVKGNNARVTGSGISVRSAFADVVSSSYLYVVGNNFSSYDGALKAFITHDSSSKALIKSTNIVLESNICFSNTFLAQLTGTAYSGYVGANKLFVSGNSSFGSTGNSVQLPAVNKTNTLPSADVV